MTVLLPSPPRGHAATATCPPPCAHAPQSPAVRQAVHWSDAVKSVPASARQVLGLRAGMAELVLLNRLRARAQRELSEDTLERAARLLEVTARDWLGEAPPCDKG